MLSIKYQAKATGMVHDAQHHQAAESTLPLICEQFYWGTLLLMCKTD